VSNAASATATAGLKVSMCAGRMAPSVMCSE
jgi:hypothetical protein